MPSREGSHTDASHTLLSLCNCGHFFRIHSHVYVLWLSWESMHLRRLLIDPSMSGALRRGILFQLWGGCVCTRQGARDREEHGNLLYLDPKAVGFLCSLCSLSHCLRECSGYAGLFLVICSHPLVCECGAEIRLPSRPTGQSFPGGDASIIDSRRFSASHCVCDWRRQLHGVREPDHVPPRRAGLRCCCHCFVF